MSVIEHNIPVQLEQILHWVKQCTEAEKKMILKELFQDTNLSTLTSEKSLAEDWLSEEEEKAWKNL